MKKSLPQAWGRLLRLLNALPDHPLKKNEILDIFYNGLTDASRDHLDSCAGCVFRERTVDQAELLLNNILSNDNDGEGNAIMQKLLTALHSSSIGGHSSMRATYQRIKSIFYRPRLTKDR